MAKVVDEVFIRIKPETGKFEAETKKAVKKATDEAEKAAKIDLGDAVDLGSGASIGKEFGDEIGDGIDSSKGRVGSAVGAVVEKVKSAFSSIGSGIASGVGGAISAVVSRAGSGLRGLGSTVGSAVNAINDRFRSIQSFGDLFGAIGSGIKSALSGAASLASSGMSAVVDAIKSKVSNIGTAFSAAKSGVADFVKGIPGQIKNAFSNIGPMAVTAGQNIVSGLKQGFSTLASVGTTAMTVLSGAMLAGALGVGVGVGALVVKGITTGLEQLEAQGLTQARLGLSDKEAERVGRLQGELWANAYGESMTEVSDATSTAIRALGDAFDDVSDDELKKFSADLINLSTAFDVGFQESADAVRGIITNDLAGSLDEATDIIAKGLQIDPSGDIIDTFREYGTELKQLGISGEEFLSMANAAIQAGARNTDLVADALKESNIRIQEGTKDSQAGLAAMGLNAKQVMADIAEGGEKANKAYAKVLGGIVSVDDKVLQNELSVAILGTKYEDLGDDVIAAVEGADKSIEGLSDTTEELDEALNDNFGVAFETLKRQFQQGLATLLGPAAEGLSNLLSKIDFGEVERKMSEAFAGLENVLGPVFNDLVNDLGPALVGLFSALQDAWSGFSEGDDSPLANLAQTFRVVVATIQDDVLPVLEELWAYFSEEILPIFVELSQEIYQKLQPAIQNLIVFLGELAVAVGKFIVDNKDVITNVFQAIADVISLVASGVAFLINAFVLAGKIIIPIVQFLWAILGPIIRFIINLLAVVVSWLARLVSAVLDAVGTWIAKFEGLKAALSTIWGGIATAAKAVWEGIKLAITWQISAIAKIVLALPSKIVSLHGKMLAFGKTAGSKIVDGIKAAFGASASIGRKVVNAIIGFINRNVIDKINARLKFTIAGQTIDAPNISRIPMLAMGDIIKQPTLLIAGEAGSEAIIPLTRPDRAVELMQESGLDRILFERLSENSNSRQLSTTTTSQSGQQVTQNFYITTQPGQDSELVGRSLARRLGSSKVGVA